MCWTGERYVMGTAVTLTTYQFAQVLGFAAGGAVVGFFGTRLSLVIDAATFAASALIVRTWVRSRPAPAAGGHHEPSRLAGIIAGARLVFARPALRTPMLFGWLAAFYNAPEGVVTPLARDLHGGAAAVGVILAAEALGETTGAIVFSRFVAPPTRLRVMGPLAVAACGILALFFWRPGLPGSLLILFASGLGAGYQIAANAAFVSAAPQEQRSQAFGLAQGGMSLGQGIVMILAGAVADHYSPAWVIAICWHCRRRSRASDRGRLGPRVASRRRRAPSARLGFSSSGCRAWRAPYLVVSWTDGCGSQVSRMACSYLVCRCDDAGAPGLLACRVACDGVVLDRGLAPVGVAHGVLLSVSSHMNSLSN